MHMHVCVFAVAPYQAVRLDCSVHAAVVVLSHIMLTSCAAEDTHVLHTQTHASC